MPGRKRAHYGHHHDTVSRQLRAQWYANPDTQCQADNCKGWGNRTLNEHPNTKTGKPPRWEAGHVTPGQVGGPYRPEIQVCNRSDGAAYGNRRREPHTPW